MSYRAFAKEGLRVNLDRYHLSCICCPFHYVQETLEKCTGESFQSEISSHGSGTVRWIFSSSHDVLEIWRISRCSISLLIKRICVLCRIRIYTRHVADHWRIHHLGRHRGCCTLQGGTHACTPFGRYWARRSIAGVPWPIKILDLKLFTVHQIQNWLSWFPACSTF